MPARHAIKEYSPDTIHHVYNRGVERRSVFLDEQDRRVFLRLLDESLAPPVANKNGYQRLNFHRKVVLLHYCLRTNHWHLLLKQVEERALESLMRSFITSYVRYFNHKYQRVGPLFQGPYKARLIRSDEDLSNIRSYIDANAASGALWDDWRPEYAMRGLSSEDSP